jgi:predicted N-acyltransferase
VPISKASELNGNYYDASSPYGYSGPLIGKEATDTCLKAFWSKVDQWYRENNVVTEFIRFSLKPNFIKYTGRLIPTLNNVAGLLSDFETIWENFKPKVRNNFRHSEKFNLETKIYHDEINSEIISIFYGIYLHTMTRHHASDIYFYEESYFQNLVLNNLDKCAIAIVYLEGKPISTELMLLDKDTIYSYLGGTDAEYFHVRPNDFLKISAIKWGLSHHMKNYILGGGRSDGDPLYKYKKSFFPKDDDLTYFTGRKVILKEVYLDLLGEEAMNIKNDNDLYAEGSYFPLYRR